jgi:hypothetical protein
MVILFPLSPLGPEHLPRGIKPNLDKGRGIDLRFYWEEGREGRSNLGGMPRQESRRGQRIKNSKVEQMRGRVCI